MNVLWPSLQVVLLGISYTGGLCLVPVRAVLVGGVSVTVLGWSLWYKQYLLCYGSLHCVLQELVLDFSIHV